MASFAPIGPQEAAILLVLAGAGLGAGWGLRGWAARRRAAADPEARRLAEVAGNLRILLDAIPDPVWVKNAKGFYLECNLRFEQLFGATRQEILGRTDFDLTDRDLAETYRRNDQLALAAGAATVLEEDVQFGDDGHHETHETIKTPIFGAGGEVAGILGIARDITERLRAEAALKASEAKFAAIFQASPIWISVTRMEDGQIVDVNEAFSLMTGWSRAEALGRTTRDLGIWADPADRDRITAMLRETGRIRAVETLMRTRSGELRDILMNAELMPLDGAPHLVSLSFDVTEVKQTQAMRRSLEAELHKADKLRSLGSLAGGVAHDMNNVLAAIMALATAQHELSPADPALRSRMETIIKACERGGAVVRGLLGFAREHLAQVRLVDLNALVREQVALLEHTTLQKVRVNMELADDLSPVQGDPAELTHALMNLCVNALDAMPEGGQVTLRTRNEAPASVLLEVTDSGQGMPPDVMARAMDPFFTTKPQGKGTGLGLSIVYGTVKAHHGELRLASAPGAGTTVAIRLPAAPDPGLRPEPAAALEEAVRPMRILVVDDDEFIRRGFGALLEVAGHAPVVMAGGEEALAALARGLEVDAVVLDINMPGLGGGATLARLREMRPDLPVLLATGRADQQALELATAHAHVQLIAKPFTLKDISACLRAI